ncbi:probable protein ATP11, mitochondrial [Zygosaccharomyces bailii]|uniref:BN860_04852g1_1 n=1 Tax=Zygosaccharomyces bailii (strain CLIB 213 / ATCC 58445 / CBS 680 / BCRC 21525 / NBRC 1098 / NCYC 1416 / NRRL Y-2227) TaxID=1333698 RepID=A0A8J2T4J9_ZYGB2|nr:BN860_04852g1_1 [Zygosaccharomyces bailii CLIB 213]SJM84998.1 probable protein ATP11, mitochondrial [Zygosaccharomyces bailii]
MRLFRASSFSTNVGTLLFSTSKPLLSRSFATTVPYLSKEYFKGSPAEHYTGKLLERAKQEGFESVEEFLNSKKDYIEKKKKELNKIDPLKELEEYEQRMKMSNNNAGLTKSKGPIDANASKLPFKTLDSFLNVEKIKDLSKQEVEFLWRAKWMGKENTLCAVAPADVFAKMISTAKANPVFVLPLPREMKSEEKEGEKTEGSELHYIQWQFVGPHTTHCMITSLAEYKLHKDFARPHTVIQFHSDLAEDKGLVLMHGHVEKDTNVSVQDSQLLLLNIQRFYGAVNDHTPIEQQRLKLLHDFTAGSPNFNIELLISLAQAMET